VKAETNAPRSRFLTATEVAVLLHTHRNTPSNMARQGKIRGAFKVGNNWRFDRAELEKSIPYREVQLGFMFGGSLSNAK